MQFLLLIMEAYRSGHNGPDSKSGSPHGLEGSNPSASAFVIYRINSGFSIYAVFSLFKISVCSSSVTSLQSAKNKISHG